MKETPNPGQPPAAPSRQPGGTLADALRELIARRESGENQTAAGPEMASSTAASCPDPGDWIRLSLGEASAIDADNLLAHVALCRDCADRLRRALLIQSADTTAEEDAEVNAFETALAADRPRLAGILAHTRHRSPAGARSRLFVWGGAGAAACLVTGASLYFYSLWEHRNSPECLLADVYGHNRIFALRIPEAPYSSVNPAIHLRGGSRSRESADLLDARACIERHLEHSPQDPRWLQLEARSDLVEENFDAAIDILDRLIAAGPVTSDLLADAATAYFQRGLATGSQNDRATALEYLRRADELAPSDPVVLFNEAVVMEDRGQVMNAVETWNRYLRFERDPQWLGEGRARLSALEQKLDRLKSHQSRLERYLASPAAMRALAADPATLATFDEELSSTLLPKLLNAAFPSPVDRSRGSPSTEDRQAARALLHSLAASLEYNHQDPWLLHFLPAESAPPSDSFLRGAQLLGRAIDAEILADYPSAASLANQSRRQFHLVGNSAGEDRAEIELSYVQQRASHFGDCRAAAQELLHRDRELAWIQITASLEDAICNAGPGVADEARPIFERILRSARDRHYSLLELRAWTMTAGPAVESGDSEEAWSIDLGGIHRFYQGDYPAFRLLNLLDGPAEAEVETPRVHLELLLRKEALSVLQLTQSQNQVPAARMWMAVAAIRAGAVSLAEDQMQQARREQATLGDVAPMQSVAVENEISLANLYLDRGDREKAAARLDEAKVRLSGDDNFVHHRSYAAARGRLELALGHPEAAESMLRKAILDEERQAAKAGARNIAFALENRDLYAVLAAVWLAENRPAEEILALWERYRLRILGRPVPACGEERLGCLQPRLAAALHHLGRNRLAGQIVLTDRLLLYDAGADGVSWRSVPVTSSDLLAAALSLERAASTPSTSRDTIEQAASRVGDTFFPSERDVPDESAELLLEPDPLLGNLPWPAVEIHGSAIGLRFNLEETPSILLDQHPGPAPGPFTGSLVVGASMASGDLDPLPEALNEAREVARFVRDPRLLLAGDATGPEVTRAIPNAQAIHFAGHAVERHGSTRLLLASSPGSDSKAYLDSDLLRKHPPRAARLAVISACSSGKREEGWNHDMGDIVDTLAALGVPEVVATRWQIDSAAAVPMMDAFYGGLSQGLAVSTALRRARSTISRDPHYRHPYYWAAYYASGTGATDLSEAIHGGSK